MKRKEETVVEETLEEVEATIEQETKKEAEKIEELGLKIVNDRVVDEDGFAVKETAVTDESDKSPLSITVDKEREEYLRQAKISKYVSYGVMFPLLIGLLVALIFVSGEGTEAWVKGLILGIVIVVVIGMFVFRFLLKRRLDGKVKDYVHNYYVHTNNYMLGGEDFSEVNVDPKGKVDKDFFNNARFYKDIRNVGSRNYCSFNHQGRSFIFVDLAASVQGVKRLEPIFVGKVLKYTLSKEINGRLVGQILGGNKLSKPINDYEGLENVYQANNSNFYSNMHKERNLLTKTVTDLFGKYKLGNDLLDVIISVTGKEIVIGLDYNDPVMQLPVEKKFDKKLIDDIQQTLFISISIIEAIADKLEK